MRYSYWYDDLNDTFNVIDAKLGVDNPISWAEQRDHAEMIVKALNAVCDGPFALNAIPGCVVNEINS
jgi:hypothetical protein